MPTTYGVYEKGKLYGKTGAKNKIIGEDPALKVVGKPIIRHDIGLKVTGKTRFSGDYSLPGMLHVRIKRSPYAHANIKKIDISKAKALPGVVDILTFEDGILYTYYGRRRKLLDGHLRMVGDDVAAVAAEDELTALKALDLISVEYEVLPFVMDAEAGAKPDAPKLYEPNNLATATPTTHKRGDVAKGFAEADFIVEASFVTNTQCHLPLETRTALAVWDDQQGILTVWNSTQGINGARETVATCSAINLSYNRVRLINEQTGGGFGSKATGQKDVVYAAVFAMRTRRPVRLVYMREEETTAHPSRQTYTAYMKAGVKKDGTITAWQGKCYMNLGAYGYNQPIMAGGSSHLKCANASTEDIGVYTNRTEAVYLRATSSPGRHHITENFIDELAEKIGMDPVEFRLMNYPDKYQSSDFAYAEASKIGRAPCNKEAATMFGWKDKWKGWGKPSAVSGSKIRGVGMAEGYNSGGSYAPSEAWVKMDLDGALTVYQALTDVGQGAPTIVRQVAAEVIGLPYEKTACVYGDTDLPQCTSSHAHVVTGTAPPAVKAAAMDLKKQLLALAASYMGVKPEELESTDGYVFVKADPTKKLSHSEIMLKTGDYRFALLGEGYRLPNPPRTSFKVWGAGFAEVEVDVETGEIKLLRFVHSTDGGYILNVLQHDSQTNGSIHCTTGLALGEGQIHDPPSGRVLNSSYLEYKVPTAKDVPPEELITVNSEHIKNYPAEPVLAFGARGTSEPTDCYVHPAIFNAIYNAVGYRCHEAPICQPKFYNYLREKFGGK